MAASSVTTCGVPEVCIPCDLLRRPGIEAVKSRPAARANAYAERVVLTARSIGRVLEPHRGEHLRYRVPAGAVRARSVCQVNHERGDLGGESGTGVVDLALGALEASGASGHRHDSGTVARVDLARDGELAR